MKWLVSNQSIDVAKEILLWLGYKRLASILLPDSSVSLFWMLDGERGKGPHGKEWRAASGQQPVKNRGPSSNIPWASKSCYQPRGVGSKFLLNKLQIDHSPADILGNEEPSSCGMPCISVNHLLKNLGLAKRVSLPPSFSKGGNEIQFMGDRTGTWSCVLVISPHSLHHVCRGGGRTKDQRAVKKKPELLR